MVELSKIYHGDISSKLEVYYQGEMKVLTFLANSKSDKVLPSDVSKTLKMTSPRVSSILNNLEKKGLIKRDFSTIDRRKVYISITSKGKQKVSDNVSDTYNLFYDILKKLGEDDSKELVRILNRLNGLIENA
jgi:DNA-binding MarR family transcriptional regulator